MRKLVLITFSIIVCFAHNLKGQLKSIESIETETVNYFGSNSKKSFLLEKFDSLDRLIYKKVENDKVEEYYFYYDSKNDYARKSIKINSIFSSFDGLPDTIIFRNSHDGKGHLINEVATNSSDSLLWIKNFEHNEKGDLVSSFYHKTPDWILAVMPEYLKDSIIYDYANNTKTNFSLSLTHEILSSVEHVISLNKNSWKFDKFGNLLKNKNVKNYFEYDENESWTVQKSFYLKNKKEVPAFIKRRKINYRE